MVRERLTPGVQDHRHTDLGAEVLLVGGDRAQRLGRRLEQDGVDDRLVLIGDRPKRRWQREHDVEILNRQQIGLPCFEPFMRGAGLKTSGSADCGSCCRRSGCDRSRHSARRARQAPPSGTREPLP